MPFRSQLARGEEASWGCRPNATQANQGGFEQSSASAASGGFHGGIADRSPSSPDQRDARPGDPTFPRSRSGECHPDVPGHPVGVKARNPLAGAPRCTGPIRSGIGSDASPGGRCTVETATAYEGAGSAIAPRGNNPERRVTCSSLAYTLALRSKRNPAGFSFRGT